MRCTNTIRIPTNHLSVIFLNVGETRTSARGISVSGACKGGWTIAITGISRTPIGSDIIDLAEEAQRRVRARVVLPRSFRKIQR